MNEELNRNLEMIDEKTETNNILGENTYPQDKNTDSIV